MARLRPTARETMFDPARFKIGLFSLNASSGIAMTTVPERWQAGWDDIVKCAVYADQAGFDFLLPLQRWRGYGGDTNPRGWCMETLTHAAGLASLTERIVIFATVQVSIAHPAWTARAVATLDHVSGGRAGLNIVCGWNEHDFAMFGVDNVPPDRRFDQGAEWTGIFKRLVCGEGPFDHAGEYFTCKGAHCLPSSLQPGGPALISAAFSPVGREFAIRDCDGLFTTISNIQNGKRHIEGLAELTRKHRREAHVFTPVHVVCRESRDDALAYYDHFASACADTGAVENYITENSRAGKPALAAAMRLQKKRIAGGFGSYGMAGSPRDIAEEIVALHAAGFAGISVSFVDFTNELPFFAERVLPLLAEAGIR